MRRADAAASAPHTLGPSRRAVLTVGAAAVSTAILTTPAQAGGPARTLPTTVVLHPLETAQVVTYDPTWATQHTLELPLAVSIAGYAQPGAGLAVTVTFDPRVLASTDRAAVAAGQSSWSATCPPAEVLPDGTARIVIDVVRPDGAPRRRSVSTIVLPLRRLDLYPEENIGAAHPVVVEVARQGGRLRNAHTWSSVSQAVPAAPWGAEVAAAWTSLAVPGSDGPLDYRAPFSVRVRSTGPAPVPAGSELVVDLDAGVVAGLSVISATLDGVAVDGPAADVGVRDETLLRGTWTLPAAVPAGSVLNVVLGCTPVPDPSRPRSLRRAAVTLVGAGQQRQTARYTSVDLTSSGTPTTDGVAVGTI